MLTDASPSKINNHQSIIINQISAQVAHKGTIIMKLPI
jgi:hypothetical protein